MEAKTEAFCLVAGGWKNKSASVLSESGEVETEFAVEWETEFFLDSENTWQLRLQRLAITGQPVDLPGGRSSLISFVSAPVLEGVDNMGYDHVSGKFSILVPMLVHIQHEDAARTVPDDSPDSDLVKTTWSAAAARCEGRLLAPPPFAEGEAGEFEVEIRGVLLTGNQVDANFIRPRYEARTDRQLKKPPELDERFRAPDPFFRGFAFQGSGIVSPVPMPICAFHHTLYRLSVQPIFVDARGPDPLDPDELKKVIDLPYDPHVPGSLPTWDAHKISGKSFHKVMEQARKIWEKSCLEFDVLPPKAVRVADYYVLNTQLEASHFSTWVKPDGKSLLVFIADSWNIAGQHRPSTDSAPDSVFRGGAYTGLGGTASAYIVTVDSQIDVPATGPHRCKNGAAGQVNLNHLAHEIGHAVGLGHPGIYSAPAGVLPASYPGTAGSVMEPSGYCADNPGLNSRGNAELMHSPLLRNAGACCGSPEIDDIVKRWWAHP